MVEREHKSIGEVLNLLKGEFTDITISKIRFLESQGLLDPERTPSGYRKFYEHDIGRLRWILTQQRDHYLPLKVIKGQLENGGEPGDQAGVGGPDTTRAGGPTGASDSGTIDLTDERRPVNPTGGDDRASDRSAPATNHPAARYHHQFSELAGRDQGAPPPTDGPGPVEADRADAPAAEPDEPRGTARPGGSHLRALDGGAARVDPNGNGNGTGDAGPRNGESGTAGRGGRKAAARDGGPPQDPWPTKPTAGSRSGLIDGGLSGINLTFDELIGATGLTAEQLEDLERFGLVAGRRVGPDKVYSEECLLICRAASGFLATGLEVRHLRMYLLSAEREAAFLEQVVTPMLRQRGPDARGRTVEFLDELVELGDQLQTALLTRSLRSFLGQE